MRGVIKAGREVKKALIGWKNDNPRRKGETLVQYRKRARQNLEKNFQTKYGDMPQWFELLIAIMKILLPLILI